MNKSIDIVNELSFRVYISSRIRPNEPLYKNLDKIPKELLKKLKEVKSDELALTRPDYIFPKNTDVT